MKNQCYCKNNAVKELNYLPRKILELEGKSNISEFVLHSICNKNCLNIAKAAYLIDNPDFNCMRGVAGYSASEAFDGDIWSNPNDFSDYMANATFNKKVRSIQHKSCIMHNQYSQEALYDIATLLGIEQYKCCTIKIPYENHGYFIYESQKDTGELDGELVLNSVSLLSFCPLY